MIELSKITQKTSEAIKINLASKEKLTKTTENISSSACNLNLSPTSYIIPSNLFQKAKGALEEFQQEFGEIKSSTYISEKIKQSLRKNNSAISDDELSNLRIKYSARVKKMRKYISSKKCSSFDEYIAILKAYIKENGSFMNCQECADLMCDNLHKKGIKADNVLLYTVDKNGQRISKAEHVFTVAGLDKNAVITDPSTWGNSYIVDGWSGICMPINKGIEFFKDFFGIIPEKHELAFQFNNKKFIQ